MNASIFGSDGLLEERLQAIPSVLRATLEASTRWKALPRCAHWDVVGVGGSEGPARLLVEVLGDRGVVARQCTVSSFLSGGRPGASGRGLIVFSQGLSPHARMVLRSVASYAHCILITTRSEPEVREHVPAHFRELTVLQHLPRAESDSLLRVVGPAAAAFVAVRVALELSGGSPAQWEQTRTQLLAAAGWYERDPAALRTLQDSDWFATMARTHPTFCLAAAQDLPAANQLMWKWQEATYQTLPPSLDFLAFIHGPFQSIYEESVAVFALRSPSDNFTDRAWQALEQVLVPGRHQLVVLKAPVAFPLSYFYFDAVFLRVVQRAIIERELCLDRWPGKGKDGALYELILPESRPALGTTGS